MWDLDAIAAGGGRNKSPAPAIFLPKGPAYKFLDELFVLVLDDRETAVTRYFAIAASASGEAALYTDEQIKVLLRESPAVVVKEWPVLRLYLPKIKKLVSGMATGAGPEDLLKIRQGLAGFCPSDNLDCPEILKVFGRTDGKNP